MTTTAPARPLFSVSLGFALVIVILSALTALGVRQMREVNAKLERVVQVYNVKSQLASRMRENLRNRAILMHNIVISPDVWQKNRLFDQFLASGENYAKERAHLRSLLQTPEEKQVMDQIDGVTVINQPVMFEVVEDAINGDSAAALALLQTRAIPLQNKLVEVLDRMTRLQREASQQAAQDTYHEYQRTRALMLLLGSAAALITLLIAVVVARRTERQTRLLENEKRKFETLFESNSDAVVILDDHGFLDCNQATLSMFGMRDVAEFVATPINGMGAECQGEAAEKADDYARRHLDQARRDGHAFMEWMGRRSDGRLFPAEIALHAMQLEGRPVIQAIMRDISQRKEAEAAMARARDAALEAVRTKNAFVANVSHEVRTPMNGILGMTDLLLRTRLDESQRQYANALKSSAKNLLAVLNDILDFSKIEAGRLELETVPFDLRRLLEEVCGMFQPRASAQGLDFRVRIDDSVACCQRGDAYRLRQIMLNLLDNAFKFTASGEVVLTARRLPGEAARYRLEVYDSGIGIPAAKQDKLFEAFSQADSSTTRRYGGTGLGLAICRQLAELMGGAIGVQSPAPHAEAYAASGSLFWLDLPLADAAPEALSPASDAPPPRFAGRILLAEDHPVNQMVLAHQLEQAGLSVTVAGTGREALARAEEEDFDLIFMDWQMPEMDGLEATRTLRASERRAGRGQVPIVALSANASPQFAQECRRAGMDELLTKPYEEKTLYALLQRWLPTTQDLLAPALDWAALRRRQPDAGQLKTLAETFLKLTEAHLEELHAALERGDVQTTRALAHKLRGACAMMLAEPMMLLARTLENRLSGGEMSAARHLLEDLQAEFIRLRSHLDAHLAGVADAA